MWIFCFVVPGSEPRPSRIESKCSNMELHPGPLCFVLLLFWGLYLTVIRDYSWLSAQKLLLAWGLYGKPGDRITVHPGSAACKSNALPLRHHSGPCLGIFSMNSCLVFFWTMVGGCFFVLEFTWFMWRKASDTWRRRQELWNIGLKRKYSRWRTCLICGCISHSPDSNP